MRVGPSSAIWFFPQQVLFIIMCQAVGEDTATQKTYKAPAYTWEKRGMWDIKEVRRITKCADCYERKKEWWDRVWLWGDGEIFWTGSQEKPFQGGKSWTGPWGIRPTEWAEEYSCRGDSNCKVLEVAISLACASNSKKVRMARAQWKKTVHEPRSEMNQCLQAHGDVCEWPTLPWTIFLVVTSSSSSSSSP